MLPAPHPWAIDAVAAGQGNDNGGTPMRLWLGGGGQSGEMGALA